MAVSTRKNNTNHHIYPVCLYNNPNHLQQNPDPQTPDSLYTDQGP